MGVPSDVGALPESPPGFEHVDRYWDGSRGRYAAKLRPGEYYVTTTRELVTTVLGSCVAACIRDRVTGVGGMNHFLLPHRGRNEHWPGSKASAATRYGTDAMEHLVNDVLANGGDRTRLDVKIFGGARVLPDLSDVGAGNIEFVERYVAREGLTLIGEDVGDVYPRRVVFDPASGQVWVKRLRSVHDEILERERSYRAAVEGDPVAGGIELF